MYTCSRTKLAYSGGCKRTFYKRRLILTFSIASRLLNLGRHAHTCSTFTTSCINARDKIEGTAEKVRQLKT